MECYKPVCVFLTSRYIIVVFRKLNSASEIVTRFVGQLKIDASLVNQKWQPGVKMATNVDCIDDICIDGTRSIQLPSVPDK